MPSHAAAIDLVDGIDELELTKDSSLRKLLVSKKIGASGIAFADVRYAQTSAMTLDDLGVAATKREV